MSSSMTLDAAYEVLTSVKVKDKAPSKWRGLNIKHFQKLLCLFLTALKEQERPFLVFATVWLKDGQTISRLSNYLATWHKNHPTVKNGVYLNAQGLETQRTRKRPRPLFAWFAEVKDTRADDCIYENGLHYHIVLAVDAKAYNVHQWAHTTFQQMQRIGIIGDARNAYKLTDFRSIRENLLDTFAHSLYAAKNATKEDIRAGGIRGMGSSVRLLVAREFERIRKTRVKAGQGVFYSQLGIGEAVA